MSAEVIKFVEELYQESKVESPVFGSGDTVNVHVNIKEGNKERVQQFQGVVIQRKNKGTNGETFTVRKVSAGIAVERIFPIPRDRPAYLSSTSFDQLSASCARPFAF